MKRWNVFLVASTLAFAAALTAAVAEAQQCGNNRSSQQVIQQPTQSFSRSSATGSGASLSQSINSGLTSNAMPSDAQFAAAPAGGAHMSQSIDTSGANATLAKFNTRQRTYASTRLYSAQPVCTDSARQAKMGSIEIPPDPNSGGDTQQDVQQPETQPASSGGTRISQNIDKTTSFNAARSSATVQEACAKSGVLAKMKSVVTAPARLFTGGRGSTFQKTVTRPNGSSVQFQRTSGA